MLWARLKKLKEIPSAEKRAQTDTLKPTVTEEKRKLSASGSK